MEKCIFSSLSNSSFTVMGKLLDHDFHIWPLLAQSVFCHPKFEVIVTLDLQRFWHKQHLLSSLEHVHKKRILGTYYMMHNCRDYGKSAHVKLTEFQFTTSDFNFKTPCA